MKTLIIAAALIALSANAFAAPRPAPQGIIPTPFDDLAMTPPLITAQHGGIADDTCKMRMLSEGGTHEIDPVIVGDKLVKAGEYRVNPFARFGGHGTTWANIDSSQCKAAAGRIAVAYGIQRVYVRTVGSDNVAVSLPTGYVFDGHTTEPYAASFVTDDGGEVKSTLKFHNVKGAL